MNLPPNELTYILLVFGLFVVPKLLQRARLPSAVTSVLLGMAVAGYSAQFASDATVTLFATLGIVALFLFAGLEVDFKELGGEVPILAQHLAMQGAVLALVSWLFVRILGFETRLAVLVALAVLTPSTGFILDSLHAFRLEQKERFWVKAKAISTELLALAVLFVVLQSQSAARLSIAFLALAGLLVVVPVAFRFFATWIRPFAPKSEFAFVIILALVCAFATRRLGVYYLVGAFIVGVAARQFKRDLPSMTSEKMLHAVEVFASFFVPFYFFNAGMHVRPADITSASVLAGVAFFLIFAPFRTILVALHRRLALKELWGAALRVSTPLLPTLVFTLVLAEIAREEFPATPSWLFGSLVLYTILNTLVPGFVLHAPIPEPDVLLASTEDETPAAPQPATALAPAPPPAS